MDITSPYAYAIKYYLWYCYKLEPLTISNKNPLSTHIYKKEPEYTLSGWYGGYSFKHFWSNCKFLLGEAGSLDGMQQLCQHYYLKNGELSAAATVDGVRRFLGYERIFRETKRTSKKKET